MIGLMVMLIVTAILALVLAYFATQNTELVSLYFLEYSLTGIPLYIVVIGSLLIGIIFSWLIGLAGSVTTMFTLRSKEGKIKNYKQENAELLKKNHQLELDNTRLKVENNETDVDDKSI